jgi:hypothetical protein
MFIFPDSFVAEKMNTVNLHPPSAHASPLKGALPRITAKRLPSLLLLPGARRG